MAPVTKIVAVLLVDGKPLSVRFSLAVHIALIIIVAGALKPFGKLHIAF